MDELLDAARKFRARGFTPIPLRGKVAACEWSKFQTRRPSGADLGDMFRLRGVTGVGLITGAASGGLVVCDFDSQARYRDWARSHPSESGAFPTVKTRRGRHVYCRSAWSGFCNFGEGELRGDCRHYVVAPPSQCRGFRYGWTVPLLARPLPLVENPVLLFGVSGAWSDGAIDAVDAGEAEEVVKGGLCEKNGEPDQEAISRAIESTLPDAPGQRNNRLFLFVGKLKAIPNVRNLPAPKLFSIVREWHRRGFPRTSQTTSEDETLASFNGMWARRKFAAGENPIWDALEDARSMPPLPGTEDRSPPYRLLAAWWYALHRRNGGAEGYIACEDMAKGLGLSARRAWELCDLLCADGLLQVVERGRRGRASRHRYIGPESM